MLEISESPALPCGGSEKLQLFNLFLVTRSPEAQLLKGHLFRRELLEIKSTFWNLTYNVLQLVYFYFLIFFSYFD